jgi:hypothetical protein
MPRKKVPGNLAGPPQTKEARHRSRPAPPLAALSVRRPSRHCAGPRSARRMRFRVRRAPYSFSERTPTLD